MSYPSRTRRPPGVHDRIELSDLDVELLLAIYEHRFATSNHLLSFVSAKVGLRRLQQRLRRLWIAAYIDRYIVPTVLCAADAGGRHVGGPLYALGTRGAQVVAERVGRPVAAIPSTPRQNRIGFATLEHHLVVTDLFAAMAVATDGRAQFHREDRLRRSLHRARTSGAVSARWVTDGGVRLAPGWVHLEVVRATAKGGNGSLVSKLESLKAEHRRKYFDLAFGHSPVRAVVVLLPTEARTARLIECVRRRAANLGNFVYFGSYREGRIMSSPTEYDGSSISELQLESATGERHALGSWLEDNPDA